MMYKRVKELRYKLDSVLLVKIIFYLFKIFLVINS